jgi:hypothetical protein
MNRIDRLTAILLLLQIGKRSAAEIAQHFEVSRLTIQRDLEHPIPPYPHSIVSIRQSAGEPITCPLSMSVYQPMA